MADSIDDVLFCEWLGTVGDDGEQDSGYLVWSIVRSTAFRRHDCSVGLAFLNDNQILRQASPADCEYVLDIEDPSATPIMAFRLRDTGEIGLVVDSHGAECAGRVALRATGDSLRRVHDLYYECPH